MQRETDWGMIVRMDGDEHILLESDERDVPTLETSRRIHARIVLPGDRWRPALELTLIDYFFLSVRTARARSARYVVDLRIVDPSVRLAREIPWGWIAVGAVFLLLAILGVRGIAASTAPWWRHEWLSATVAFFAVAAAAMYAAVHRTAEAARRLADIVVDVERLALVCGIAGTVPRRSGDLPFVRLDRRHL